MIILVMVIVVYHKQRINFIQQRFLYMLMLQQSFEEDKLERRVSAWLEKQGIIETYYTNVRLNK